MHVVRVRTYLESLQHHYVDRPILWHQILGKLSIVANIQAVFRVRGTEEDFVQRLLNYRKVALHLFRLRKKTKKEAERRFKAKELHEDTGKYFNGLENSFETIYFKVMKENCK